MAALWILYITFSLMGISGANHYTGYIAIRRNIYLKDNVW